MLKKSHRLSQQKVKNLLRKGQYFTNGYLSIKCFPNKVKNNRFGVIISKKVLNSAVQRNFKRRQIYEILRLAEASTQQNTFEKTKFDCIILIKPNLLKLSFSDLQSQIIKLLKNLS